MVDNLEDSRIELISKVEQMIDEKIDRADATLIKEFLEQFYLGVSSYDLRSKSIVDLYGALISMWHFIYRRATGESKIRVYNTQIEQHGWQSMHTVIEIIHENKPFLLDSLRFNINKMGINIHSIIHAEGIRFLRDEQGKIIKVLPLDIDRNEKQKKATIEEAPIYFEIDKQTDAIEIAKITSVLSSVMLDVDVMVADWAEMLSKLKDTVSLLSEKYNNSHDSDLPEVIAFLKWLADNHFTFIGYAEYNFVNSDVGGGVLQYITESGLGVFHEKPTKDLTRELKNMYPEARDMYLNSETLLIGKTDTISTVHRPVYTDFIAIKTFNAEGKLRKVIRFVGLYTSIVYNEIADNIPFVRQKIERVFKMTRLPKESHDGRALLHILETLPRDELFLARDIELYDFAIGILHLQERQKIRLFMRRDVFGRYFSCLVFVPRELFTSQLRQAIQDILVGALHGQEVTFDSKFSESLLARIHFTIRVNQLENIPYNTSHLESKLIEAARTWGDDLKSALVDHCGEERANELLKIYLNAFPLSYREIFSGQSAVIDIEHIESLKRYDASHLEMSIYRPIEDDEDSFRFKIFRDNQAIPLSDIVPILERMGLRIISERPHEIKFADNTSVWVNDYHLINPQGKQVVTEDIADIFQDGFIAVWHDKAENDGFNRLILAAELPWRDVTILRAMYRYLWQTGFVFSQSSVEDTLSNNARMSKKLIEYFYMKFDPENRTQDQNVKLADLRKEIEDGLEQVESLNEDRIIRHYLDVMLACVRTNFYQLDDFGKPKTCCSYKFDSIKVPDLPLPKPLCEIFVYSPYVEGIHLRADRVARGGLRLSDRQEDFRTEVLGLMKTQQVKNAVIVPLGAKGGFVIKADLISILDQAAKKKMIVLCYQTFVRGLLDLTDNYHGDKVVRPVDTVCWDIDDPYLVVAADKGTATYSDVANEIAKEYNFWLGDAFASGGCTGYDHKKLAITARGAWESVKMHFHKFNIDVQTQSVTVFGIGDLAGDVFGNGMLQSSKIKLLAAFNHIHIFFDPDPNPESSFNERKRMFNLPSSTWEDYDPKVISEGGGVFSRSAKKIILSPQMKKVLNTTVESMLPNELIIAILTMNVDLFFNGGIGTFVKATSERNADVGDRANDAIRINGFQLNAKVVCEGGNLGFTQLARIEYARKGGLINTDAIDNSGGVNCSDCEVNIKILLNEVVNGGDMTEKQRNVLLASMANEVADLVLENNINQNEALTLNDYQAAANLKMHTRLLRELERTAGLDPVVEFLPNEQEIAARELNNQGFTRPELAVLLAYTKIYLKKKLISSLVLEDPYVNDILVNYFPKALHEQRYIPYMQSHRLKRAIISTQISNMIIDEMGINFIQRLEEESGEPSFIVAKAYLITQDVFNAQQVRAQIRGLGCDVDFAVQLGMTQDFNRLIRRSTRWFLRNKSEKIDIAKTITQFKPLVNFLCQNLNTFVSGSRLEKINANITLLTNAGVPIDIAKHASSFKTMFAALDIAEAAIENNLDILLVAKVFFAVGANLKLGWFGELINKQPVDNNWEALARAAFRDDVDKQQRNLAIKILLDNNGHVDDPANAVKTWLEHQHGFANRWEFFVEEFRTSTPGFTMFAVALRELLALGQDTMDSGV